MDKNNVSRSMQWLKSCMLILAITSSPIQAQMTTPGQFQVSESGAATFTIPIQVPPGIAGMEPKLSMSYNSQSGNGLLGLGWAMSGLGSITRCPRTKAQDGVVGGVNFDNNDKFCIDGERLIAINGTYGADGTEYRTERESFSKIISYSSAGNGPAWFRVWTKAGQVMEYGHTTDSQIEAQGKTSVRVWALNRIEDSKGNYITASYIKDAANGDYYPNRIDYTGNSKTGQTPKNSVQFQYEIRPDVIGLYQAGSVIKNTVRMKKINIFNKENLIKIYSKNYKNVDILSRKKSMLASIVECDATSKCNPVPTFNWNIADQRLFNISQVWLADFGANQGWTDDSKWQRLLVDVNGDGLVDVVGFDSDGVYVALNTGTSFQPRTKWISGFGSNEGWINNNRWPKYIIDVNGDGLPDVVGFDSDGVYVALNSGASFQTKSRWLADFGASQGWTDDSKWQRLLVDVNGDGLVDVVGFDSDGVYVALNTGTSFQPRTKWISGFGSNEGWINNNRWPKYIIDVNGDGLPDVVGFDSDGVYVALNSGASFQTKSRWLADFGASQGWTDDSKWQRLLVDVNGDGLVDVVGFDSDGVYVALNTGTSFQPRTKWISDFGRNQGWIDNSKWPISLTDVNGDGLADIVGFNSDGAYVSLATGSSFLAASLVASDFGTNIGWRDVVTNPRSVQVVNSNGVTGIVGFKDDGVHVSTSLSDATFDKITAIKNSEAVLTFSYKSILSPTIYTKDAGMNIASYPLVDIQSPLYVVSSVVSTNGVGGTTSTQYTYGGLKSDQSGRGLLGFRWQQAKQVETGLIAYTEFKQEWPYTGLPSLSKKTLAGGGNNGVLSQTTNSYSCNDPGSSAGAPCNVGVGKRYFVFANQSVGSNFDLNGAVMPVTTTKTEYDNFGNATKVDVSTSDGFSKSTINSFSNDSTNWFLGRLLKSTVTSVAP